MVNAIFISEDTKPGVVAFNIKFSLIGVLVKLSFGSHRLAGSFGLPELSTWISSSLTSLISGNDFLNNEKLET